MDGPAISHTCDVIWSHIELCLHMITLWLVMLLTGTVETGAEIDWWGRRQGRRVCKVKVLKADVFLKTYIVYTMGSTVASVTNYLPLQLSFQSLQDFVIFILISDFITSYSWEFRPFISCYFYLACAWNYFRPFKLRVRALKAVFHSKPGKIFAKADSQKFKQKGSRQRLAKQTYVFLILSAFAVLMLVCRECCFNRPLGLSVHETVAMFTWHSNKKKWLR